ncbi:hypothetical protein JTE90_004793 [Oedothorax gibbosus]|uniref:Uncharacterized protein n=1 Tax=Oedothorax gibbosus TaxID=931172 RepID=A0AAV6VGX1_9ARAC|nr:hypothetical protein JTE90_004793 [Oedothorax gibbosus]
MSPEESPRLVRDGARLDVEELALSPEELPVAFSNRTRHWHPRSQSQHQNRIERCAGCLRVLLNSLHRKNTQWYHIFCVLKTSSTGVLDQIL